MIGYKMKYGLCSPAPRWHHGYPSLVPVIPCYTPSQDGGIFTCPTVLTANLIQGRLSVKLNENNYKTPFHIWNAVVLEKKQVGREKRKEHPPP